MEVDPELLSWALQVLQRLLRSRVEDELGLLWSTEMKEKLIVLEGNLSSLGAVLHDAETLQLNQMEGRDWLRKFKDAVFDAEDVVDMLGAEALRLKVENKDRMGKKEQQQSPLLSSLEVLKIVNSCDKQTSLPGDGIILNSLRELNIRSCGNLKSLSSVGIKNLTTLIIFDCSRVWSSTKWLGELSSLRNLIASSCPDMTNFPESIGNLTSLEKLRIEDCHSLTSLPQSMGDLELLRNLTIENCPRVTCFPQGLERLGNLQELSIDRCPDLERVLCENGRRGEDWSKVARVPNISIAGQNIRAHLSREESSSESEEEADERPSLFGCTRFNAKLLLPSCSSPPPP